MKNEKPDGLRWAYTVGTSCDPVTKIAGPAREEKPRFLPSADEHGVDRTLLANAVDAFLLAGEAANHTLATHRTYDYNLARFSWFCLAHGVQSLDAIAPEVVQRHLSDLCDRVKPVSVHQRYRVLRTFFRWCVRAGHLQTNPMAAMTMRLPRTLPLVPSDSDVRRLLAACSNTPEGHRNRALIALAADSGLRKEELRHLRIGDLDFAAGIIHVWSGKGRKDAVAFFGGETASLLRAWLSVHPDPRPTTFVLCTRGGVPLGPYAILRILHRLSVRAWLDRKVGPHALRHFAATAIWRRTGDVELVRRVLRHETLAMALRYVAITQADVAAKFRRASPLDHLHAGRQVTGVAGRS